MSKEKNVGEVAASDDVEMRLRAQAAIPFGPEGFDLITEATQHIAYLRAQLARQAAPHAQAEPVGYISEGTRAMLAAGCSTPITISISTGKVGAWCAPMYLSVPVPRAQAEPVAWLRFWAAQYSIGEGNIGVDEGLEVCEPHDIGMDGRPAFPVYAEYVPVPQEAEQAAPAAVTDERAMFEAHMRARWSPTAFERNPNHTYVGSVIQDAWSVWQARAALARPTAPVVTDAARDVLADATLVCPQCGVDRLKKPCPNMADECAMVGDAYLLASFIQSKE